MLLRRMPHRLQAATKVVGCYEGCNRGYWLLRKLSHKLLQRLHDDVKATTERLPHRLQAATKVAGCCEGYNIAQKSVTLLRRLYRGYGFDLFLKTTNATQAPMKVTEPSFPR
ncbi:hypothetical protein Tco_0374994 [Tanacetum coccineum]